MAWNIVLGVSEDADLRTVKRAYSKLIKQYRPNEHPEKFAEIREAFEEFKRIEKYRAPSAVAASTSVDTTIIAQLNESQTPSSANLHMPDDLVFSATQTLDDTTNTTNTTNTTTNDSTAETPTGTEETLVNESNPAQTFESVDLKSSSEDILKWLDTWQQNPFQNGYVLDRIFDHPILNSLDGIQFMSPLCFDWFVTQVYEKKDRTVLRVKGALDRFDEVFLWSREERYWCEHYQQELDALFDGFINRPMQNYVTFNDSEPEKVGSPFLSFLKISANLGLILYLYLSMDAFFDNPSLKTGILFAIASYLWVDWTLYDFQLIRKVEQRIISRFGPSGSKAVYFIKRLANWSLMAITAVITFGVSIGAFQGLLRTSLAQLESNVIFGAVSMILIVPVCLFIGWVGVTICRVLTKWQEVIWQQYNETTKNSD